jgi:zinc protease
MNTYVEHIAQISPDDIIRVAQTYFVENNRTVGWSLPKNPEKERQTFLPLETTSAPPATDMVFYRSPWYGYSRNESHPPAAPEIFSSNSQRLHHHHWTLANGLTVLFLENHVLPIVSIEAFVEAGQIYEIDDQAGVAVLTGQLLDEGTTKRSGFEIAQAIESIGGTLDTQSQGVSGQFLSKDIMSAMDILSEVLIHPIFDPEKLEKKRHQILASFDSDEDNLALIAYNLFREMVYGPHPYHRPRKGYKETLQTLIRRDVVTYYSDYFRPNNTILAIVGDAQPDGILNQVQRFFGAWESCEIPSKPRFTIPQADGCIRQHIPREKVQNHLYLGHLGITRTNPDFYALFLMDHILGIGAGLTDRISRKLRDQQGLAYTVSANISFSAEREPGIFAAYIATSPTNMDRAIDGLLEEIRRIRTEPVSREDLELAKDYVTGSYVFNFETSTQLAHYLINVERYHLGEDFIWNFPHLINGVTVEDIQRVAQHYLDPDNYYIASAGKL